MPLTAERDGGKSCKTDWALDKHSEKIVADYMWRAPLIFPSMSKQKPAEMEMSMWQLNVSHSSLSLLSPAEYEEKNMQFTIKNILYLSVPHSLHLLFSPLFLLSTNSIQKPADCLIDEPNYRPSRLPLWSNLAQNKWKAHCVRQK